MGELLLESGDEPALLYIRLDFTNREVAERIDLLAEAGTRSRIFGLHLVWPADRVALGTYISTGGELPAVYSFGSLSVLPPLADGVACHLSARSLTKSQVHVTMSDLPSWLQFEVDGFARRGPIPGRFFEKETPIEAVIRPIASSSFLGHQQAELSIRTTDFREEYKTLTLGVSATFEVAVPCVEALPSKRIVVAQEGVHPTRVELRNFGNRPADFKVLNKNPRIGLGYLPSIPPVESGRPGRATLDLTVDSAGLSVDRYDLPLTIKVDGGAPESVEILVKIRVVEVVCEPASLDFGTIPKTRKSQMIVIALLGTFSLVVLLIILWLVLASAQ